MYTEKYAATAPPTAAGGASLGVVGGRIDFWDNGYQQAISQPYTVAPGETLQTHCWFSTTPMASQIEFGTPTSSEMCQDFIFYYPAQYRGVDAGGSPERFAMCGISGPVAGAAITLCGSLAQSGGTTPYIVGDQVDKGDGAKADPLNFGTANRGANASVPGSICAYVSTPSLPPSLSPSPSPAPSPPSPFSPGSELVTVYRVKVELIAEGSVSDITTEKKAAIQRAFATAAGVPESRVAVTVQAASVLISVIITSMTQSSASAVQATLAAKLVDSAAATEFLEEAAIVVTSTPVLTSYSETVAQDPLDTVREARDRRHGMHVAHGLLMTLAFGFFMPAGTAFPLFLRSLLPHGRWLRWHNGFQLVGLALCTAGFGVGIAMSTRHFRSLHTILGLVVVILSYLQGGLAVVRPKTPSAKGTEIGEEPPTTLRRAWEILHKRVVAVAILGLSLVQLVTGVQHPVAATKLLRPLLFGLYGAMLLLAGAFLVGAFVVKRRASAATEGAMESSAYNTYATAASLSDAGRSIQLSRAARVSAAQARAEEKAMAKTQTQADMMTSEPEI